MTIHERLAYARKKLHMTQAQFSERICVAPGFLSSMEIGGRKINPRMMRIINLATGISSRWLETGEGEMFGCEMEDEIEEIVGLYRQLSPFFKGFFRRQLLEIVNYESAAGEAGRDLADAGGCSPGGGPKVGNNASVRQN